MYTFSHASYASVEVDVMKLHAYDPDTLPDAISIHK